MNEKPWHKKAAERIKMEVLIRIKSILRARGKCGKKQKLKMKPQKTRDFTQIIMAEVSSIECVSLF